MTDVRLTATNPADSSVVPVSCNAKGELLLEEPIYVEGPKGDKGEKGDPGEPGKDGDPFTGNFDGDVSFSGSGTFTEDVLIHSVTVGTGAGGFATNTAVGRDALPANTAGTYNTAVGRDSLLVNTAGLNNTAVGASALSGNTEGQSNTAVGTNALQKAATSNGNTAVGTNALRNNANGENNVAVGRDALLLNTAGGGNTAVGRDALNSLSDGDGNIAVGGNALRDNVNGDNNTAVGRSAGKQVLGSANTFVGNYQGASGLSNTLSLSTGVTERMRISSDDAVDFNQKCGFTADGGLWITDTRGNKLRTTFAANDFMQWEPYEVVLRNEPQIIDSEEDA